MSRPRARRTLSTVVVASLVSLVACSDKQLADLQKQVDQQKQAAQAAQQNAASQQTLITALAPDAPTVYINFTCGTVNHIGLFDSQANGNSAWGVQRHPGQTITWIVPNNVTIKSLAAKPGTTALPIDVDPNQQGGSPGKPFVGTVQGPPGGPPSLTTYSYAIDLVCTSPGKTTELVIDPEFIVNKP